MNCSRIGLIGCGSISRTYAANLNTFPGTEVVCCYDINDDSSRLLAKEYGLLAHASLDDLLGDGSVDTVLVLTHPESHQELSNKALESGKHVYCEKPAALTVQGVRECAEYAAGRDLLYGCAPDTWMGGSFLACKELLGSLSLGELKWVQASMLCAGHEGWHPNPAYYYRPGGGPLWDMGPYYLTWLALLCGPILEVEATAWRDAAPRAAKDGSKIDSEVFTHYQISLRTERTPIQMNFSFCVPWQSAPNLTFCFDSASVAMPDPNCFDGQIEVLKGRSDLAWQTRSIKGRDRRGIGVRLLHQTLDSDGITSSARLAMHVIAVMEAVDESATTGRSKVVEQGLDLDRSSLESILKSVAEAGLD